MKGGELKREGNFFRNRSYSMHLLYRKLGQGESRVINAMGGNIKNLLKEVDNSSRTPLLAIFVIPQEGAPIIGMVDVRRIPKVCRERTGRVCTNKSVFLREDDQAVFVHLRDEHDIEEIVQLSRESLPEQLFYKIFKGVDLL